jgi:enoyl-CoA hydratase
MAMKSKPKTITYETNQTLMAQGLYQSQMIGTTFDGTARHTKEGYEFQRRAAPAGFKSAARHRDEPFGEPGF